MHPCRQRNRTRATPVTMCLSRFFLEPNPTFETSVTRRIFVSRLVFVHFFGTLVCISKVTTNNWIPSRSFSVFCMS